MKITFFNVGQGDSIVINWEHNKQPKIGIIDAHLFEGRNRIIEYLEANQVREIEFIIISHIHYDHYSGIAGILKYCQQNQIPINSFYHTFAPVLGELYQEVFTSKKIEKALTSFVRTFDEAFEKEIKEVKYIDTSCRFSLLENQVEFQFIAPSANIYHRISRRISLQKYDGNINFSLSEINKLATIIAIKHPNKGEVVLLTSDAVKQSFLKNRKRITETAILVQAPHHGSINNIDQDFWQNLSFKENCPAVFSVGYEPKDKLPNVQTVKFFDNLGYDIQATNCVYGLNEYFENKNDTAISQNSLDHFSSLRHSLNPLTSAKKLTGDKTFELGWH